MAAGRHVVMFSGGVGSWATAQRVIEQHDREAVVLLFADTLMEDEDLYRFLHEAADDLGAELRVVAEGRDPWQVFFDERFLGNSRIDPCSKILKRRLLRKYIDQHFDAATDTIYLGIDWNEEHRFKNAARFWEPWSAKAPLCDPPYLSKEEMLTALEERGIKRPRLYELGFSHNNCGGFCIKAGQSHYKLLYETMPERYLFHERREQELRDYLGKDVSILVRVHKGKKYPLTLKQLRMEIEAGEKVDPHDWGGCGCFSGI